MDLELGGWAKRPTCLSYNPCLLGGIFSFVAGVFGVSWFT